MRATVLTTLVLAALAGTAYAASPLPEVAVTSCGQIVPKKTLGYLTGDLDCSGYVSADPDVLDAKFAVTVGWKSKLDLRGFTITASEHGVLCDNLRSQGKRTGCEVFGGTVTGATQRGIGLAHGHVHDVTVTNNGIGVYAYAKGGIEDVVVTDSTYTGIDAGKGKVQRATVTNSGILGVVSGGRLAITDSTVTGSGTHPVCTSNPEDCGDIASHRPPKVEDLVCGKSIGIGDGAPATWGVCAGD